MSESYIRNLPVPYVSQRENSYPWEEKEPYMIWNDDISDDIPNPNAGEIVEGGNKLPLAFSSCNITCLCMVLNYLGVTQETPDQMLEKVFDVDDETTNLLLRL
jgi:hypothetical protein